MKYNQTRLDVFRIRFEKEDKSFWAIWDFQKQAYAIYKKGPHGKHLFIKNCYNFSDVENYLN